MHCKITRDIDTRMRPRKYLIEIWNGDDMIYSCRMFCLFMKRLEKKLRRKKARAVAKAKIMLKVAAE